MSEKLRVGVVIGQLHRGGAERQVYELATRLRKDRIEPFVYCLSADVEPFGPLLDAAGVAVRMVPRRRSYEPGRILALARHFSRDRPQVVHALADSPNLYSYLAILLAGRRPFLASNWAIDPTVSLVAARVNRLIYKRCDRVVVNSRPGLEFTRSFYGIAPDRIEIIPNGLDTERFQSLADPAVTRSSLGIPAGSPVIGYLGRFSWEKRPELFLEACRGISSQLPDARFLMVGDGPLLPEVRRLARGAALESRMIFAGFRDDAPDLLSAMDLLLLTSSQEGLPNAILEAMAAGRPVVATDVGGCGELVVEGITGHLVGPDDLEMLVGKSLGVLSLPDRGRALGEAGRRRVFSEFGADVMTDRFRELYQRVYAESSFRRD
jgi:glycosyltransferase involved in cell wall biosynthesis